MKTWRNVSPIKEQVIRHFIPGRRVIVFDVETTGLSSKDDKIIQFSGINYLITATGLREIDKMDLYINPERPLSDKIIDLTGITDYMLSKARNEIEEAPEIFKFLENCDFLAAYNCNFDLRFLRSMSERTQIPFFEKECIDVLQMARDMISKNELEKHTLSSVAEYLFPDIEAQFHSSYEDTKVTAKIMAHFVPMYKNHEEDPDRIQTHLEWATYIVNPNAKSQVRIKLMLTIGEFGDIFWDCIRSCWSCKSSTKAKKLFERIDLKNLEQQVLKKYGWKYHAHDMETLAKNWGTEKKKVKDVS